jgi:tetratricopeptide (TPR) repeat protein
MIETTDEKERIELKEKITTEMNNIPRLRRRIGGKTIPVEKLAIYTSNRYFRQNESLSLPIFEVFYFYNILSHTGGKAERIDPILVYLEKERVRDFPDSQSIHDDKVDSYCLLLLLKGACLRYKKCLKQATECYTEIIQLQDRIVRDTYIPPHAALELGITYVEMDKLSEAKEWLEKSRTVYKGFLVEAMLHLRTHAAFREVSDRERALKDQTIESSNSPQTIIDPSSIDAASTSSATEVAMKRSTGIGSWIRGFV